MCEGANRILPQNWMVHCKNGVVFNLFVPLKSHTTVVWTGKCFLGII